MDINTQLYDFMNRHDLMVISTIGPAGRPQSALVGFGQTKDLEIVFASRKTSRKATNIAKDSNVSAVIGGEKGVTLQYEGAVEPVADDQVEKLADMYAEKVTRAAMFKNDPEMQYYIIRPSWIRLTDVRQDPWKIDEVSSF